MNKIGYYLQDHVTGEVVTSVDARRYFSTDNSVLSLSPALILYPKNENDVRKTARFTWQLAERNRIIPITARGSGTDHSGAAIGNGIVMVFPAHMNRILELDTKSGDITVEPGLNYGKLQQTLQTHGRFLPPFPATFEYSTIGGAIANNSSGEKSIKYGATGNYVQALRVVLANGEVIATHRLNKRELNRKLGLTTFEGEIYRSVDTILEEHKSTVDMMERSVTKNSAGYNLLGVKNNDGTFDLTPLIVGSQGTLGIITEITLDTEIHNPETSLIVALFDELSQLQSAVLELKKAKEIPSAIEMVDGNLLSFVDTVNPNQLKGIMEKPYPKFILLVEYDGSERLQKKVAKRGKKILEQYAVNVQLETEFSTQELLWNIRQASTSASIHSLGNVKALPIIEDSVVPADKLQEFINGIYEIFKRNHLQPAIWGHAGDVSLSMLPYLDLSQVGDRQKAFRMMDEYYNLVMELGGSISGEHSDGRLRGPYLQKMYGTEVYDLLQKVKKVFDPYGTLNPGVKLGVTIEDLKALLRHEYTINHLYEHLPRS
ncbi:MAG: FAD-binding oxidoreductase [Candidatus Saccharimonadales bacterium]